jgi:hypothetical protein
MRNYMIQDQIQMTAAITAPVGVSLEDLFSELSWDRLSGMRIWPDWITPGEELP